VAAQAGPLSAPQQHRVRGQTAPVTVTLEPTATLAGTVYLPTADAGDGSLVS